MAGEETDLKGRGRGRRRGRRRELKGKLKTEEI
jgi:hypothetical protein